MAKRTKKVVETEEISFFDLAANAGITFETIKSELNKFKDPKKVLRKYRGFIRVLGDEASVDRYISNCVKNGILALDTETNNSLDVHSAEVIGLCLYTPLNRPVYIPLGHRDKITNQLLKNQVSKDYIKGKLEELKKLKIIYHNSKFDTNVIRFNFKLDLPIYWDTLIAAKILDENRLKNGLKLLYSTGIDPFSVDYHVTTFFEDNVHSDIEDFGLYSAMDPYETFKVYEKQLKELSAPSMSKLKALLENLEFKVTKVCADMEFRGFTFDEELCKNYLFTESAKLMKLGEKVNELLEPYRDKILNWRYQKNGRGYVKKFNEEGQPIKVKKKVEINKGNYSYFKYVETDEYEKQLDPYAGYPLDWPIKLTSPDQVLCLLNCILGLEINSTVIDDLKATGSEIADLIGKYRHLNHNLTSFFKPYLAISKNSKIYATFDQMGDEDKTVKTGRFSSREPNLQQLPARQGEDSVRMLFKASEDVPVFETLKDSSFRIHFTSKVKESGKLKLPEELEMGDILEVDLDLYRIKNIEREGEFYFIYLDGDIPKDKKILVFKQKILAGADFSAQEPRVMSSLCGERELIDGYNLRTPEFPKGKDFYAMLASSAYNKDYWECTEFDREGKFQQDGKNRRQDGKVIQLGVSYGMGAKLLVENLNKKKKPGEVKMTVEEGQAMMESFFGKFRSLGIWKDYNRARLEQFGYMETALGRRRRLFDTWLPDYTVKAYSIEKIEEVFFNMSINIKGYFWPDSIKVLDKERTQSIIEKLNSFRSSYKQREFINDLEKDPLNSIRSNAGFKSKPLTQSTNFIIQGGAAELTKRAMVSLYFLENKEELGLEILAPVHDEILVEGYLECREEVLKTLSRCMSSSAENIYEVNMICDGVIESRWNLGHFTDKLQKEFSKDSDIQKIYKHYQEISPVILESIVQNRFNPEIDKLIANPDCIIN